MPDAGAPACPPFRTTTERRTCPPWTTEGVRTWTPETDRSGRFAAWAPAGRAHARSEATRAVALTVDRRRRCIGVVSLPRLRVLFENGAMLGRVAGYRQRG